MLIVFGLEPAAAQGGPCVQSLQNKVDVAPPGSTVDVPACTYHETVFVGHSVTLDGQNRAVIDGDNTRDRWVWIGASNVTVKNFSMRNAATALEEGAIGTAAGISGVTIDHNDLGPTSNGMPIAVGGTTDSKVTNNQVHGGGQLGISTYANTRLTISGNHIFGNNTAGVDPFWGGGALKANQDSGLILSANEVDHNAGPGLWVDVGSTNVTISGNTVHDQTNNPIFFEVSSGADIFNNTVYASATNPAGNWGCIISSSAANVNIHDNACQDTFPLRAQLDARGDLPPGAGTNNVLRNNRLVRPTPANQATSWWQWSTAGPLVPGQNGNVDSGNVIVSSLTPTPTTVPKPTVTCQVEVWLNGVSQGRKPC